MKRVISQALVVVFSALVFAAPANAGNKRTVDVKSGQKTLIYNFAVYLTSCGHVAYPKMGSRGVKNGKVTSANGSFIANSGQCKGKRLRSTAVYYQSKPGFRGTEKFRVSLGYPLDSDTDWGTKYEVINFTVNVK